MTETIKLGHDLKADIYKCIHCDKACSTKVSLNYHLKSYHKQETNGNMQEKFSVSFKAEYT